jgi:osmoprotectant transport system substrate-binding protein
MANRRRILMQRSRNFATARLLACASAALASVALAGCGGGSSSAATPPPTTATTTQTTLPGAGKPQVTIGDKNYTEQFVLGQLYYQALQAQGFPVLLNQNIGPTEVTLQALKTGQLAMYPEYLNVWNSSVAGYTRNFKVRHNAYVSGQRYALTHGLVLLDPTPFSDTSAVGVTVSFAQQHRLREIGDLRKVASTMTLGAAPQLEQDPTGLPALEQAYGFSPAALHPLEIGKQYQALDQGTVEAAYVNTTDAELTTGNYALLADPLRVFGVGNVVPVASSRVLDEEGPAFEATINKVSSLLTLDTIRELNAQVDLSGQDPASVAKRFLVDHGVVPTPSGTG